MKLYNSAAWLVSERANPLTVLPAPFPGPETSTSNSDPNPNPDFTTIQIQPDEIIIRARAVAINPVDWKIQTHGNDLFPIPYPAILGADVAGEIIHVGSALTDTTTDTDGSNGNGNGNGSRSRSEGKFRIGQRVIAHALGLGHGWAYSSFQRFVVLKATTALSVLPDEISFERGVVLPVSVSTATVGLFWRGTLGLRLPGSDSEEEEEEEEEEEGKKKKETLLLWGGSSSVGSSVVQLATAAGYHVVATASSSNFEYVKHLGAVAVVDYHDEDVIKKLVKVLEGTEVVGAYDSIGTESTVRQTAEVLRALGGGKIASVGTAPDDLGEGVEVRRFSAGNIDVQEPEIGRAIWEEFVPRAVEDGRLRPFPEPLVVGHGLESIQTGLDRQKQGVSAKKVVVTL